MNDPLPLPNLAQATFQTIQKHYRPLLIVAGVLQVVPLLLHLLLLATRGNVVVAFFASVVTWAVRGVAIGIFTPALLQTAKGQPIVIGTCVQDAIAGAPRILPTALLLGVAIGIGSMLYLLPGLIAFALLALAVPMAAHENLAPLDALRRSFERAKERWQDLAATLLAVLLVLLLAELLLAWLAAKTGLAVVLFLVLYAAGTAVTIGASVATILMYQSVTGQLGQNRLR